MVYPARPWGMILTTGGAAGRRGPFWTQEGAGEDVGASDLPVLEPRGAVRCCKCPRERRARDEGWYWMDLNPEGRYRVYACPRHYLEFAAAERGRWSPIHEVLHRVIEPAAASAATPFPIGAVPGHDGSWVI